MTSKDEPETEGNEQSKGKLGRKAGTVFFPRNSLNEALRVPQVIWEKNAGNPFPLLDIDSDNGGKFINTVLYKYCRMRKSL